MRKSVKQAEGKERRLASQSSQERDHMEWVLGRGAWAEGRVRRSLSVIPDFEKSCQCCHYSPFFTGQAGGEVIWQKKGRK